MVCVLAGASMRREMGVVGREGECLYYGSAGNWRKSMDASIGAMVDLYGKSLECWEGVCGARMWAAAS
jgi:hypothetical protein